MAGPVLSGSFRERLVSTMRGLLALGLVAGMVALVEVMNWDAERLGGLFGLGLLLLAGSVAGTVAAFFRLPRLTGYLVAGIIAGPHVLGLIDKETVKALTLINALALALIALDAGAELTMAMLRRSYKSLLWQSTTQTLVLGIGITAAFGVLAWLGLIDFLEGASLEILVAVAFVWGAIAISKSPAATLAIMKETRSKGPVSDHALGMVVLFDVIVLVLFAVVMMFARGAVHGGTSPSLGTLSDIGVELVASVAAGVTFGLLIAFYFWAVGRERLLFLLLVAYGVTAFCKYFHYDTLLVFAVAGFVVANLTREGPELVATSEKMGSAVMVVFFATAGAKLDLDVLRTLWPIALLLAVLRMALTLAASKAGHRLARDEENVRRYGYTSLISQAGVTIGLATIAATQLGEIGAGIGTLAIAVVGINEIVGPVIFKIGLARAGETGKASGEATTEAPPTSPPG